MKVSNEKELGIALEQNQDSIEIEGDLSKKVIKIKATGKVAWGIAIGCMSVVIPCVISTVISADAATPVTAPAATFCIAPATAALGGVSTAFSAASIAAGAASIGGINAGISSLNKLRRYKLINENNKVILKRK